MPASLLLAGSGPAGASLPILKTVELGKGLNDVAFCGNWLALAISGTVKVRLLRPRLRLWMGCRPARHGRFRCTLAPCLAAKASACPRPAPGRLRLAYGPPPSRPAPGALQTDAGSVQLHRRYTRGAANSLELLATFAVGALPDQLEFSKDCR